MLKATLTNGDLILGLDKENINRLRKDDPILIRHDEIGDVKGNIYIVYGDDMNSILNKLKAAITSKTKFKGSQGGH